MDEAVWVHALPDEAAALLLGALGDLRNRDACFDFLRWVVARGLWYRNKEGFHLVRGSHKHMREGLKEDPFLKSIGLTADKIRGAVEACRKHGILEVISSSTLVQPNRHGLSRRAPNRYRFEKTFYDALRRGLKGREASASYPPKTSSLVPSKAQVFQNRGGFRGGNASTPLRGGLWVAMGVLGGLVHGPAPAAPARSPAAVTAPAVPPMPLPLPAALRGPVAAPAPRPAPVPPSIVSGPPAPSKLDRSLGNLRAAVIDGPALPPIGWEARLEPGAPPPKDEDFWSRYDRAFVREWSETVRIGDDFPRVFDREEGFSDKVRDWLDANVGKGKWSLHWFNQRDVAGHMRGSGPAEMWRRYEIRPDLRIGFEHRGDAFSFAMMWRGIGPGEDEA